MKPYLIPNDFDLKQLCDSTDTPLFTSGNLALYVQNESPSVPTNHGIGVLADAISCSVKHQVNGQDELVMTYPDNGQLADKIEQRCLIVADVERRGNQPYRIYRIAKDIKGNIKIYARHLAYDLGGIVVEPFSANDIQAALNGLKTRAMTYNPFTFTTTRTTGSKFTVNVPSTVWSLMGGQSGSLLDVYGGEYSFNGYTVSLENRIGSDTGVSVRYGVNMTDFSQDENCANCYTGVVAYWQDMNGEKTVYSPVVNAVGNFGYVRIMAVDMSSKWEEKPTESQLKSAASSYITRNKIGVPKVSWKVNFVPLETTEEYKNLGVLERVNLGDTVGVKFEKIGVDATARVNEIEWDVLRDKYISVSLGSVKSNIADTIAKQTTELAKTPSTDGVKSIAMQISSALAKSITGASGGSVRLLDTDDDGEPDTLYIADDPDPAQAVKVWRFNYNGWAASQSGYNGPFVMGATLNDGLLANFVTAANLTAGTIQSADGESFYANLDTGVVRIGGYAKSSDLNNANQSEQVIYRSKASGTTSVSAPTSWITSTTGAQDTWTIKRPIYDSDYPVLFVATQRKAVGGAVTCTTPLVDQTTTVIDGGHITTGSIDAERITTGTMSADRIYGGTLSLGGNNNVHGKLVLLNAAEQPIAESDWMGISFYSGLSQADKHIIQRISRNGFSVNFSPNGDGTSAGSAVAIGASYNGATAYGSISVGTVTSGATSPKIVLDGETGRIDCKSLYINGQQVTP